MCAYIYIYIRGRACQTNCCVHHCQQMHVQAQQPVHPLSHTASRQGWREHGTPVWMWERAHARQTGSWTSDRRAYRRNASCSAPPFLATTRQTKGAVWFGFVPFAPPEDEWLAKYSARSNLSLSRRNCTCSGNGHSVPNGPNEQDNHLFSPSNNEAHSSTLRTSFVIQQLRTDNINQVTQPPLA